MKIMGINFKLLKALEESKLHFPEGFVLRSVELFPFYGKINPHQKKGSYFNRESVDYKSLIYFKEIKNNLTTHNQIRSLIFEPFQLPIYNDKKIIKSIFKNKKIRLLYLK